LALINTSGFSFFWAERSVSFSAGVWSAASNACVSDRRQRETASGIKTGVEAAACSLDAMVRHCFHRTVISAGWEVTRNVVNESTSMFAGATVN
jgi:hypothetical protein